MDSFVVNPSDPPIAVTPHEAIWKRGKTRLLRYGARDKITHPAPYLIVPWLGISRPYVLDLLPGNSMIEYLVNQGHDVYLLDWGEIAEEDKELGFEEGVFKLIPRAINRALEASEAQELTLNGICLGGTLSACYLAIHPDAPVRNFVAIVAPINFEQGDLFRVWLDERYFPADLIVERYGGLPASLMNTGFKMLRPTLEAQALSGLWANAHRPGYVTGYKAMSRWANDFIGMPGRFFSQLSKELYGKDRLMKKEFVLNGHTVDLARITQPLLCVAAARTSLSPPLPPRASSTRFPAATRSLWSCLAATSRCSPDAKPTRLFGPRSTSGSRPGRRNPHRCHKPGRADHPTGASNDHPERRQPLRNVEGHVPEVDRSLVSGRRLGARCRDSAPSLSPSPPATCKPCGRVSSILGPSSWARTLPPPQALKPSATLKSSRMTSWRPWPRSLPKQWAPRTSPRCWASTWSRPSTGRNGPRRRGARR